MIGSDYSNEPPEFDPSIAPAKLAKQISERIGKPLNLRKGDVLAQMWAMVLEQDGVIQSVSNGSKIVSVTYMREGLAHELAAADGRIIITCLSGPQTGASAEVGSYDE